MVIEWLNSLGYGFGAWVLSIFPPIPFFEGGAAAAAALGGFAASLSPWVNWAVLAFAVGQVVSLFFIGLGVKIIRAIAAHIPLIGGAG